MSEDPCRHERKRFSWLLLRAGLRDEQDSDQRRAGLRDEQDSEADLLLKGYAQERGFGETCAKTRVGVFLGEPDTTVPDPTSSAGRGADPETGVVDARHRVFGYQNLLVCDGAAVPANVGVNPLPDDHRAGRARHGPHPTQRQPG